MIKGNCPECGAGLIHTKTCSVPSPANFIHSMSAPKPTVCKCGQGYASAFDGKCGQHGCRNKREREAHKRWHMENN